MQVPEDLELPEEGTPAARVRQSLRQSVLLFKQKTFPFNTLIENKIKFSSYIRKFRMEQLQSHI
jgi:hypothetical protein